MPSILSNLHEMTHCPALQVLVNTFQSAADTTSSENLPAASKKLQAPPLTSSLTSASIPARVRATSAGMESGILYESVWQAVEPSQMQDQNQNSSSKDQKISKPKIRSDRGVRQVQRLLRSPIRVEPSDCVLIPCPRGSLVNLRFVPLQQTAPRADEVQV